MTDQAKRDETARQARELRRKRERNANEQTQLFTNWGVPNLNELNELKHSVVWRSLGFDREMEFTGIRKWHNRYQARIWENGKRRYLGSFSTPEEAHAAYKEAANDRP